MVNSKQTGNLLKELEKQKAEEFLKQHGEREGKGRGGPKWSHDGPYDAGTEQRQQPEEGSVSIKRCCLIRQGFFPPPPVSYPAMETIISYG